MYTALPTDIQDQPEPEPEIAVQPPAYIEKIQKYILSHSGSDFGGMSPTSEKVQYLNEHRQIKRHGGKPPVDYSAVEDFVDLQLAFQAEDFVKALTIYFKLSKIA